MLEKTLLIKVEQALSAAWGGAVRLAWRTDFDQHPHVARLTVAQAPASTPATVILKRWRVEGEARYDPGFSAIGLHNDWTSLEFLANVMGAESPAPQVYAGNIDAGFLVLEDLASQDALAPALQNGNSTDATQALVRYGKLLGQLHGRTAGHIGLYTEMRKRLNTDAHFQPENYGEVFEGVVAALKDSAVEIPPAALQEIQEAAEHLSQPGDFTVFTHGDPVFSNILHHQNRWRLIDFEAARLRHALYEGVYLRMLFPTSGLLYVQRIPETSWRQAEEAYRATLCEFLPAAQNKTRYGSAVTAACAFWVLSFYGSWLPRALGGEADPGRVSHIRRCLMARGELFVATAQEFQSMGRLGEFMGGLTDRYRTQWPPTDCELPLYPAFRPA